jgi:hypothetical protein
MARDYVLLDSPAAERGEVFPENPAAHCWKLYVWHVEFDSVQCAGISDKGKQYLEPKIAVRLRREY